MEAERTFPFDGELKILDPEGSDISELCVRQQKADYLRAFDLAQKDLTARFAGRDCAFTSATVETPVEISLRRFVDAHRRLG